MTVTRYVRNSEMVVYTGSNGQEFADHMGAAIISDDGVHLAVGDFVFAVGDAWGAQTGPWRTPHFEEDWTPKSAYNPNPTGTMDGVSVAVPLLLLHVLGTT